MPTEFDTEIAAGVTEILDEVGIAATLVSKAYGYSSSTGDGTITPTNVSVKCTPPQFETVYDKAAGRSFRQQRCVTLLPPGTTNPAIGDALIIGSNRLEIVGVAEITSGELVAIYDLILSGGSPTA